MNWDLVFEDAVRPTIVADSAISLVVGESVFLAGLREVTVPSITALMIVDTETENWAPADWQFDVYARSMDDVRSVARRVRLLLHHDVQQELGDYKLWTEFLEGRGPEGPDRDGFYRYSMDFRFTPGRSLYLTAQES